jgi:hypothetical protein
VSDDDLILYQWDLKNHQLVDFNSTAEDIPRP